MLVSLYHFSDTESKTEDGYFVGFPAIWNVVVLYCFVLDFAPVFSAVFIALCAVLTFIPLYWVHPLRVRRLRLLTFAAVSVWGGAAASAILHGFPGTPVEQAIFVSWRRSMSIAIGISAGAGGEPPFRSRECSKTLREKAARAAGLSMELLFDPAAWASLITLTALEIVLGVDNIVVLSILTHALPPRDAQRARAVGLGLALGLRLALLSAISWITRLTYPVFSAAGQDFSWRDLILIGGGLFLMVKATQEIHAEIEGREAPSDAAVKAGFGAVISQIALMDLVFSLDSIITAVGSPATSRSWSRRSASPSASCMQRRSPVGGFIKRHPTTKMLGLCFLILIGVALVADGFGLHIPRGYIYFAMAFAGVVEAFNVWAKGSRSRRRAAGFPQTRALGESAAMPPAPKRAQAAAPDSPRPAQNQGAAREAEENRPRAILSPSIWPSFRLWP